MTPEKKHGKIFKPKEWKTTATSRKKSCIAARCFSDSPKKKNNQPNETDSMATHKIPGLHMCCTVMLCVRWCCVKEAANIMTIRRRRQIMKKATKTDLLKINDFFRLPYFISCVVHWKGDFTMCWFIVVDFFSVCVFFSFVQYYYFFELLLNLLEAIEKKGN